MGRLYTPSPILPHGRRCLSRPKKNAKHATRSPSPSGVSRVWLVVAQVFGGGCPELTGRLQGTNPTFSFPSQASLLNSRSYRNVADHRDVDVHTLNAGPVSNRYKHLFSHHGADVLDGPKINASL
jgi:hypothetical protein